MLVRFTLRSPSQWAITKRKSVVRVGMEVLSVYWQVSRTLAEFDININNCIYTLSHFTNSVDHSPSWEVNISSAGQKIRPFCGTPNYVAVFTRALHLSLSWPRWIQPTPSHPDPLRYDLILSSHLLQGLRSDNDTWTSWKCMQGQ
jgi:hypothetical protein